VSCRILVLPVVGSDLLASFSDPPEERGAGLEQPSPWAALADDLVRYSRQDSSTGSEVYLCFLGDQIPNRPAVDRLRGLLDSACSHAWGSQTFLVTRWDLGVQSLRKNQVAMLKWLESAREGRAADVLQVYDPSSPVFFDPGKLQEARDQTAARRTYLLHRPLPGRWSCRVRMERQGLARLLEGEGWMPLTPTPSDQLLVVVDRTESDDQMPLVEEAWDESPRRCLVATLQVDPSADLVAFCRERDVEILAFSGVLELWHFFLVLNDRGLGACQEVALDRQTPLFESQPVPSVLFTNAWNPDARTTDQVLQAAHDLGVVLAGAPLATSSLVYPAVTRERLFQQLGFVEGTPLIWIHTGPGCEEPGLVDADGKLVPVETWLDCFNRGSRLPVAVFLCGGSAPVALRFAAAGAGIAIGFEGAELTSQARRLAIDVLSMALQTDGSREAVLRAWNAGFTTSDMSRPRAYYSR
jgi:hypothetical protein